MTPTADYSCLSKKCQTDDGAAPVYELPIDSVRCPRCGSKRIKRLFNKVTVLRAVEKERDPRLTSSSALVRSTALLRPGFDHHDAHKPGYTPPGGGIDDPARYNKLESFTVSPSEFLGIAPGKAHQMTSLEVARDVRQDPTGAVAFLKAGFGGRVRTNPLRPKGETE